MQRTLRDFRLAGVDKDDATRKRIQELRDELTVIGQDFDRNIRTDVKTVTAKSAAELDGLPADYIARHKPNADGSITLTIDYPDSLPVFSYAKNEDLRSRMYMAYQNRAYPANMAVLDRMLAARAELARLLGYSDWASYITADKMVGTAKHASDFIDRIVAASGPKAEREYAAVLKRKQQDVPGADGRQRVGEHVLLGAGAQVELRLRLAVGAPLLPVRPREQGLLDVTSRLFGVTYRPIKDAPVWDPSVEAYEMLLNGQLIGRFYLDMHPRPNKFNHAAEFGIRTGVAGRQIPEAALVCNLPGGEPGDPGLMTHDDVTTFFHEFGHLVHALLAGRHRWVGIGGNNTEQDFVEAPSQMLEEWTWDPATLATFAKHYQTNEPIPAALVRQMRRASEFGKALGVRQQMIYAKLSLSVYDRDPKTVDTTALVRESDDEIPAVSVRRGHALPDLVRPPRRLLRRVLHLHVVARHREGPVRPVQRAQPAGPGGRAQVPRHHPRPRRLEARRPARPGLPRPSVRLQGLGRVAEPRGALAEGSSGSTVLRF